MSRFLHYFSKVYSHMQGFYELSRTVDKLNTAGRFFSLSNYFPDIMYEAPVTGVIRSTTVKKSWQEVNDGRDGGLPKLRTQQISSLQLIGVMLPHRRQESRP